MNKFNDNQDKPQLLKIVRWSILYLVNKFFLNDFFMAFVINKREEILRLHRRVF